MLEFLVVSLQSWRQIAPFSGTAPVHRTDGLQRWRSMLASLFQAKALAAALERRHSQTPFRLVQSADYLATGLFVRRRHGRVHVVRCSSAADLFNNVEGLTSKLAWCNAHLERLAMKRANLAYAPSRYIAQYFTNTHKLDVQSCSAPKVPGDPKLVSYGGVANPIPFSFWAA